jgi:hypothetical protein
MGGYKGEAIVRCQRVGNFLIRLAKRVGNLIGDLLENGSKYLAKVSATNVSSKSKLKSNGYKDGLILGQV